MGGRRASKGPEGGDGGGADVASATQAQLCWVLRSEASRRGLRRAPRGVERRLAAQSLADRLTPAATELDLSGEYLGPRAACCVAALARHLPLLQTLSLRGAGLYAADATQREAPPCPGSALVMMGVPAPGELAEGRGPVWGNDAVDAVAAAAEEHPSLTALDLSENQMGTVGAKRVLAALERNGRLRCVDLGGSDIDTRTRGVIDDQLRRNCEGRNPRAPERVYAGAGDLPPDTVLLESEERSRRGGRPLPAGCAALSAAVRAALSAAAPAADPAAAAAALTAGSLSGDHVWVVVRGHVVVTLEEPARGRAAKGRAAATLRLQPGDLLPYLPALRAAGGGAAPAAPVPHGWGSVDADAVQLSAVLGWGAVAPTAAVAEPGAELWRAPAHAAAPALGAHLRAVLPGLAAARLLQALGWSDLLWLADYCEPRSFEPGDDIATQGAEWAGVHLITRGSIAVERQGPGGAWAEVASLDAGDAAGVAAAASGRHVAACVARTPVAALLVAAAPARRLLAMPQVRPLTAGAEA